MMSSPARRKGVLLVALGFAIALPSLAGTAVAQSGVEVTSGIRYATHGGVPLLLDAYLPAGRGPHPAVIVIPGGRWVEIDRTKHSDVPAYFAEHGIAAFAIDYRSALDSPFPAAVSDVAAAVRWVRAHAEEYDVDPAKIGAIGVSSGGHLAALVASRGTGVLDRGSRLAVVASWSGMMDLRPLVDAEDQELRGAVRTFLGCTATEPCTRVASAASPIVHVDPSDPPMVLVNGSEEIVPVSQAESMGTALEAAGIDGHVTIAQGGHGAGYGGGTKILDQVFPFIGAWLTGEDPPPSPAAPSAAEPSGTEPSDTVVGSGDGKATSSMSPRDAGGSKQYGVGAGAPVAAVKSTATGVGVIAVAMIAVVVVFVQFVVIGRLRRRTAAQPRGRDVPTGARAEGT
jgi:acetyl esterase/lipase